MYALIRHIVKDPVKYPDNMSSSFKSFLKGLLNKVPQNRLTWPALLEHPFVKETSDELEMKELHATSVATRACNPTWRGDGNASLASNVSSPGGKIDAPAGFQDKKTVNPPNGQLNSPNSLTGNNSHLEEFPGFVSSNDVKHSGCQILDKLEDSSRTVKGAQVISQDTEALTHILRQLQRWSEMSQNSCREQTILSSSQSLRILSNLAAAGAIQCTGRCDEVTHELLVFTSIIINLKLVEVNDLIIKSFSIVRTLVSKSGGAMGSLSFRNWVTLAEIFSQVICSSGDLSGEVVCESTACVAVMLSKVALGLKASSSGSGPEVVCAPNEILRKILEHAKTSGLVDHLCLCLATSGASLISGSSILLRAACEACRAIWSLIESLEVLFVKENTYLFPLNAFRSPSLLRLDIRDHEKGSLQGSDSTKVVDAVTRAFLKSNAIQVSIYYCLHQRHEAALSSCIQILLRCCLHNGIVPGVLCGLPSSLPVTTVVSGGGDGTIVAEAFNVLSLCISVLNKDSQTGDVSNLKCKLVNPSSLVMHSCLLLATVAQCLKSMGRNSALFMLTTSPKRQLSRLTVLAHSFSSDDKIRNAILPHCASGMLALASILSLEIGASVKSSVSEISIPLIPRTATLCDYLKISSLGSNDGHANDFGQFLSHWHGYMDGCVGLLEARLRWGGPLAVQQLCASNIPHLLVNMLAKNGSSAPHGMDIKDDQVGLSPIGLVWTVSSISHCLLGGSLTFRQILIRNDNVKLMSDLISDAHLKLVKSWGGPGGGKSGVRDIINVVIDLLAFPFVAVQNAPGLPSATASVNSGFLLNMGSPGGRVCMDDKDLVKAIEDDLGKYIKILLEVGVPGVVIRCLEYSEFKDIGRPVAFLAKMISHRPLAVQLVGKGLLDANRMRRLLDTSNSKEILLDILMIISDLARTDKAFYEYINGASILEFLKEFLAHEDPNIRAKACSALGNMCRHSSYFYGSLARYEIINLLIDRCSDADKRTRKFACFAIGNAAYHDDTLYGELRRSIPQLANLLVSSEEDKTKANAAGALSNLVRNSNMLCEDIVSRGAMQALLKLVADCSAVALNPSRKDAANESPLKIALFSLAKMCAHAPCRQFLLSSKLFPVIGQLRQSPESTIAKYASVIVSKVAET